MLRRHRPLPQGLQDGIRQRHSRKTRVPPREMEPRCLGGGLCASLLRPVPEWGRLQGPGVLRVPGWVLWIRVPVGELQGSATRPAELRCVPRVSWKGRGAG